MEREETSRKDNEQVAENAAGDLSSSKEISQPKELAETEPVVQAGAEEVVEAAAAPQGAVNSDTGNEQPEETEAAQSVKAKTHAKKRTSKQSKIKRANVIPSRKHWQTLIGLGAGALAITMIVVSGVLGQYFKGKTMPGVYVAGTPSAAQKADSVKQKLQQQKSALTVTIASKDKKLEPTLEDIGLTIDVDQTIKNALSAKRQDGLLTKLAAWKKVDVPAVVRVDEAKLSQYVETQLPELSKAPQDSRLEFSAAKNEFVITPQADGEGVDTVLLKNQLLDLSSAVKSRTFDVQLAKKAARITEKRLRPLLGEANELTKRQVLLTGTGYTFKARPADIASWITPTPQDDGSISLVVDSSKVQGYIDAVGKRIASPPLDRKVVRDQETGQEVVIQEGRSGTELASRQELANAVTAAIKKRENITQQMEIITATYQTINMEAYDRWIEVDLSQQRATLYTGATAVQSFTISSGLPKTPTVTGEFKVWHKNPVQTMTGGSRAGGDYYSLPNVKWNTYFYKDYAFHTAYWHNNFGRPMSHGCVNMREAEAKIVYDFAPIGTTVIVHN